MYIDDRGWKSLAYNHRGIKMDKCDHKINDELAYERIDDACTTDRGAFGGVWFRCKKCEADISELVEFMFESMSMNNDLLNYYLDEDEYEDVKEAR